MPISEQPVEQHAQQFVIWRGNLHGQHGAQPAGKIGQTHRPARRRRAAGDHHGKALLGTGVEVMQQIVLAGEIGIINRAGAGGQGGW